MEFVRKAGDTMTGALRITANGGDQRLAPITGQMRLLTGDGSGYANMALANPTAAEHAATKGYVDNIMGGPGTIIQRGYAQSTTGGQDQVDFPVPFTATPTIMLTMDYNDATSLMCQVRRSETGFFQFCVTTMADAYISGVGVHWLAIGTVAAVEALPEEG